MSDDRPTHPIGLTCSTCGETYDPSPDIPWRCRCGLPLDFAEIPLPDTDQPPCVNNQNGLWAFDAFIPIEKHISFNEGFTPLVTAPVFEAECKLEYVFPTGSFKDRGATTIVSRAAELGVETLVDDSSGNAGTAIATYTARSDIDAKIYVPVDAKPAKRTAIERAGAEIVEVEGSRNDVTKACLETVASGDAWYASHAWSPAFYAGTMTAAFEIAAQRDWVAPDAVVSPLGHGTLFLGLYRGFNRLQKAGWIDQVPKLLGAQGAGYAPIAAEFGDTLTGKNTITDGIHIEKPARRDQIIDAVNDTDGDVIALSEASVETALNRLHQNGFYTEPTSAVVLAALIRYREEGTLATDDDTVLMLTGSGLKSTSF